ncbi:unnamed protein product [[Candida] boidinii]|uniref:Alternative oxidase n=1 Tax=Candida boidinii TaxID=5477 RepID=A0A9W6WHD9_CANBO|nr:hypothetical protein B5S30_g5495 [[Candida] boidinii]OWB81571.1 hypothetical protein B5S33_g190 [[Candida] boidinii]GME69593.1 unnamed protein product [[Candida] boidinii]GMF50879.1 unnamed protein product [[Candida] boidinii]GMF99602.1 unnamed protein product [[Candida] boidinii]
MLAAQIKPITTRTLKTTLVPIVDLSIRSFSTSAIRKTTLITADNKVKPSDDDTKFLTKNQFEHPNYESELLDTVKYEHRPCKKPSDYIALSMIKILRHSFDFFTGFKEANTKEESLKIYNSSKRMTPEKWLNRIIFLESVAGVPGSVAGFLRHLQSLRLLRRDKAFIETLYDEAYNERMHLLTFLKLGKPGIFSRSMLYIGQGVFSNIFFFSYLMCPRICHRFVGYLEEEAVSTYTRCINDIDYGLLPEFNKMEIPDIAKEYWHLDETANMRDLVNYVRADEAKHREVNHTFANLKLRGNTIDRNPFALAIKESDKKQPSMTLKNSKAQGWEREDLIL